MDLPSLPLEVKRICIVGGGAAGLATLRILADSPHHLSGRWKIDLYEAREQVGGIWFPAPPTDDPPISPLYDSLTTNLPHPIMAFKTFLFPSSTPVFPRAHIVLEYLQAYAQHYGLMKYIHLSTRVTNVERVDSQWSVTLSSSALTPSETATLTYDHIIICNGHYYIPRYPSDSDTQGLASWLEYKKAIHSAWYRSPDPSWGSRILVVGVGPSGQDISRDLLNTGHTVIRSHPSQPNPSSDTHLIEHGPISHFSASPEEGTVYFEDGSAESNVSLCILATGYQLSFPFLPNTILSPSSPSTPSEVPPIPSTLTNSSYHIFPLAKHVFPLPASLSTPPGSICFIGLPTKVAPFPLFEAQAWSVRQVLTDPSSLDLTREAVDIVTRYETLCARFGDGLGVAKRWHKFEGTEQFEYRDMLYDFSEGVLTTEETDAVASEYRVEEWEKEMYSKKDILRFVWNELVRSGEAEEFVRGVDGKNEWVAVLRRMIAMYERNGAGKL